MSKNSFQVGDRAVAYSYRGRSVGNVIEVNEFDIKIKNATYEAWYHHKQCRKLKPKEKSVRVTRKMLEDVWTKWLSMPSHRFDQFAKDLGL